MRRLAVMLAIFSLFPVNAFALLVTDNVDKTEFKYEVGYRFATSDLQASLTAAEIPVIPDATQHNFYYVVPRDGRVVGISVAGNNALSAGGATFDVTINGTVTGIQTVIESPARTALGESGSSGTQFAYMRQDRAQTASVRGFRSAIDTTSKHDTDNPYGRATPITAGNRIGVRVTTSSTWSPATLDYIVTIYVLE